MGVSAKWMSGVVGDTDDGEIGDAGPSALATGTARVAPAAAGLDVAAGTGAAGVAAGLATVMEGLLPRDTGGGALPTAGAEALLSAAASAGPGDRKGA